MTGRNSYNWYALRRRAAKLVAQGTDPNWTALSDALDIPRPTFSAGMKREFGLELKDLPHLPELPLPSDMIEDADESRLPAQYRGISPQDVIRLLKKRPRTITELSNELDRGPETIEAVLDVMRLDGFLVAKADEGRVGMSPYQPSEPLPTIQDGDSYYAKWGVFSDPHFGSKHAQTSALLKFIEIAVEEHGVTKLLCAGDLTAGVGVYRGQHNELYAHGAKDQVDSVVNTLPEIDGVQYIMIGGNHDWSFFRQTGTDVIRNAAQMRDDFVHAGWDQAEVPLVQVDGQVMASAILWHPTGGVPYALSYKGQKFAAEISRQELTDIVAGDKVAPTVRFIFWGHLHVSDFFPHGPIWVVGPGCFEGTNGYLKAKGLKPVVQGMVVEARFTETGMVQAPSFHPIPFQEQERSYFAGWVPELERKEREVVEPVFSMTKAPD